MTFKRIALAFVLADFLCLSAYAVYVHGVVGMFEALLASPATLAASADLLIALSLIAVWVWNDARRRGISPLPYLALTATLGSAGPLLYLLRIGGDEACERVGAPVRGTA